jgi:hypothetical protein
MKLCRDCAYFHRYRLSAKEFSKCSAPPSASMVTGEPDGYARLNRRYEHLCGKDAKWFQPAPSRVPWLLRAFRSLTDAKRAISTAASEAQKEPSHDNAGVIR